MSYQTLIDALIAHDCKVNLATGMATCPAHDDRDPSLAITERGGTVLIHCHAGCTSDSVLAALGLSWPEVLADSAPGGQRSDRPTRRAPRARQTDYGECVMPIPRDAGPPPERLMLRDGQLPSRRWHYRDAAGRTLCGVLRWDLPAGDGTTSKEIRPLSYWRRAGMGGWRLALPPVPRPLYGLDRLAAKLLVPVLVCEGEKACDAASGIFLDHVCVCWAGGASAIKGIDWSPLRGRQCVLWPDHDQPGRLAMNALAGLLSGLAGTSARVVELPPGLPAGWDLADPAPAGLDLAAVLAGLPELPPSEPLPYAELLREVLWFSPRFGAGDPAWRCGRWHPELLVEALAEDPARIRKAWYDSSRMKQADWIETWAAMDAAWLRELCA